jgi:hypothetical protein
MKLKNLIIDEYEAAFPFEAEYTDWISCMEYDYAEPAKLVVTDQTNIVLHKDNREDYSPFVTINS